MIIASYLLRCDGALCCRQTGRQTTDCQKVFVWRTGELPERNGEGLPAGPEKRGSEWSACNFLKIFQMEYGCFSDAKRRSCARTQTGCIALRFLFFCFCHGKLHTFSWWCRSWCVFVFLFYMQSMAPSLYTANGLHSVLFNLHHLMKYFMQTYLNHLL